MPKHVVRARNTRTVAESSNTNGLQELTQGRKRKFKELDTLKMKFEKIIPKYSGIVFHLLKMCSIMKLKENIKLL